MAWGLRGDAAWGLGAREQARSSHAHAGAAGQPGRRGGATGTCFAVAEQQDKQAQQPRTRRGLTGMDDQAFDNLLRQAFRGETAAVLAAVAGDQALLHRSNLF